MKYEDVEAFIPFDTDPHMMTVVSNRRGLHLMTGVVVLMFSLTCVMMYCACTDAVFYTSNWWVPSAFLTAFAASLHLLQLLLYKRPFTRLSIVHAVLFAVYGASLGCCAVAPFLVKVIPRSDPEESWRVTAMITLSWAQVIGPLLIATALAGKDESRIQYYLHPFMELVDGYSKSAESIRMETIKGENGDDSGSLKGSLKQVVVEAAKPEVHGLRKWPKNEPFLANAIFPYRTTASSELSFAKGDQLMVTDARGRWWKAELNGKAGFIPSNFVKVSRRAKIATVYLYPVVEEDEVALEAVGEIVEVMAAYEEYSLVRTAQGKIGIVPSECLLQEPLESIQ